MKLGWPWWPWDILSTEPWWRHQMETFSAFLMLCEGNPPITDGFPSQGQWCGALMFSLICTWPNGWDAGDLRRHRAHSGIISMILIKIIIWSIEFSLLLAWTSCLQPVEMVLESTAIFYRWNKKHAPTYFTIKYRIWIWITIAINRHFRYLTWGS